GLPGRGGADSFDPNPGRRWWLWRWFADREAAPAVAIGPPAEPCGQVVECVQRGADRLSRTADAENDVVSGPDPVPPDVVVEGHEVCCAGGVAPFREVGDDVARMGDGMPEYPVHRGDRVVE